MIRETLIYQQIYWGESELTYHPPPSPRKNGGGYNNWNKLIKKIDFNNLQVRIGRE